MKHTKLEINELKSEKEEALFWQEHDSTDYLDWCKATAVTFAHLKPSLKSISLRIPEPMLNRLRSLANKPTSPINLSLK